MHGSVENRTELRTQEITGVRPRQAGDSPKSVRTRARILNTAMRLFADIGYHPASNAVIAEAAGLTRGAMLYHFASREAMLDALIPHLQAARSRLFERAASSAPAGADRTDHAIDSYWELLHETPFVAFAEMEAAARTDTLLRDRLRTAQAAFDRLQLGEQAPGLAQSGEPPRLQASRDLARFVLEGLSRAHLAYDGDARTERLLAVVKRAAHMLNRKGATGDLWP